jgi:hypothetical protein
MRVWKFGPLLFGITFLGVLGSVGSVRAQQPAPAPSPNAPTTDPAPADPKPAVDPKKPDAPKPKTSIERETGTINDRIFEVMPNYGTVYTPKSLPPMTTGLKFRLATAGAFDYFAYPFNLWLAAMAQAHNDPKSWGQGWGAYGKRFGASFGDNTIGTYMTTAIYPTILKEDPRYYRMAQGKFTKRAIYPISRLVVTRADSGQNRFDFSELLGNATATGISNAYHAPEDRTLGRNLGTLGMLYMWDGVSNEMKEFWPDIRRKVLHKETP